MGGGAVYLRSAAATHVAAPRPGSARRRRAPVPQNVHSVHRAGALRAIALLYLPHACVSAACGPCQTAGPTSPAAQPAWLAALKKERESVLASINYTGGVFANPSLGWTQGAYIQPQVHPYDRFFFDEVSGNYTVDRFLADLEKRYGGVDAVLLWPTYTNLGIDDRNQFDFFRAMPGGLDGVKQVTAQLHAAGVRVLWPYNPWDNGTRREALDDQHTLAALLKQTGGDGFNGDTMGSIPRSFWAAALQDSYPIALEPEDGGTDASLNWATMGWGYWLYPHVPQVDRFKYLTRGKFMTNVCDRWATRKTDNLQSAWFNGAGYESWENVWGTWNGIVPRDAEALRRVSTMLRFFGGQGGLLQAEEWEPHTPAVLTPGVFGSRFPNGTHTLYTLVNRAGTAFPEVHISLPEVQLLAQGDSPLVEESHQEATRYFDCYRGVELSPHAAPPSHAMHGSHVPPRRRAAAGAIGAMATPLVISLPLEKEGYGCVLGVRGAAAASAPPLVSFLRTMAALSATPLQQLSATWRYLPQALVPITATRTTSALPAGMVAIPAAANFSFVVRGIEVEGDDAHGVDVQYPWERCAAARNRPARPPPDSPNASSSAQVAVPPHSSTQPRCPRAAQPPATQARALATGGGLLHGQVPRDQRQLLYLP